jgi:hypothetical protein
LICKRFEPERLKVDTGGQDKAVSSPESPENGVVF